ncbi:MAG: hypothetical protein IJC46_05630 [Clostridia bacterium]|nr:hypothetical protein [Clostridia bacterium]
MRKIINWIIILAVLFSVGGCKRAKSDEGDVTTTVLNAAGTHIEETETKEEGTERVESVEESDPPLLDGMKVEQVGNETVVTFDLETCAAFPTQTTEDLGTYVTIDEETSYSDLMEWIGEDGIIVAGYVTGLRESHTSDYQLGYTLTKFQITDLYYGDAPSEIRIKEPYCLKADENNEWYFSKRETDRAVRLTNGERFLLALQKNEEYGCYIRQYSIKITEDYRDYSEDYKTHLLNFFRGDRSEYAEQGEDTSRIEYYLNENNEEVAYYVPSENIRISYWPKRDISDEALLEELQENVVVRLITDYKIKIWPYGHKNYTFGPDSGQFVKSCTPD